MLKFIKRCLMGLFLVISGHLLMSSVGAAKKVQTRQQGAEQKHVSRQGNTKPALAKSSLASSASDVPALTENSSFSTSSDTGEQVVEDAVFDLQKKADEAFLKEVLEGGSVGQMSEQEKLETKEFIQDVVSAKELELIGELAKRVNDVDINNMTEEDKKAIEEFISIVLSDSAADDIHAMAQDYLKRLMDRAKVASRPTVEDLNFMAQEFGKKIANKSKVWLLIKKNKAELARQQLLENPEVGQMKLLAYNNIIGLLDAEIEKRELVKRGQSWMDTVVENVKWFFDMTTPDPAYVELD